MNPQSYSHENFNRDLAWMCTFTPATAHAAASLSCLSGERILVVCHLYPGRLKAGSSIELLC